MRSKLLLGIICFGITMTVFFPYYGVRNRVFNEVSTQTGLEIFAGSMWPTLMGIGVSMKEVTVQLPARASDGQNVDIEFKRLKVYVPWSSLLAIAPAVQVEGKLVKQGSIGLTLRPKGKEMAIHTLLQDVDGASYVKQFGVTDVNFSGHVNLDLDTVVDTQTQVLGKTKFSLEIKNVAVSAFEVAGFNVPSLSFGSTAVVQGQAKDGKAFEVTLNLGKPEDPFVLATEGSLDLDVKRLPGSTFVIKNAVTLSPTFTQNETISMVLPLLEQFKKEGSTYHIKLTGSLGKGVDIPTPF